MVPMEMTLTDATERVLREHSRGAPMHYRRITELAVEHGWIVPGGLTPEQSLNAAVTSEIKRRAAAEREQRFASHGRGFYGLAAPSDPLGGAIDAKNKDVEKRLRELLSELDPRHFENLIGQLLVALGFEDVVVTKYSGDGGIDLRARLAVGGVTDVRTAIQVKRWSNSVSGRVIRELRGGLGPHERGLVITLSTFTKDARSEAAAADRSPISLVDGDRLVDLLVDNDIGVSRRKVTILELDEGSLLPSDDIDPEGSEQPTPIASAPVRPRSARTDKVLSVWPLPGGGQVWKESLDAMLAFVAESGPTMREAIAWMIQRWDRVNSEKVARGYWQVPRSFGLLETVGEHIALTADGATYLESPSDTLLLTMLRTSVAGFDELLAELEQRPLSADAGLSLLNSVLGVGWESDAQVRFRLGWLENVGVVTQRRGVWTLRSDASAWDVVGDGQGVASASSGT
jgi:restriction system protein